jgi:hypothetical protein
MSRHRRSAQRHRGQDVHTPRHQNQIALSRRQTFRIAVVAVCFRQVCIVTIPHVIRKFALLHYVIRKLALPHFYWSLVVGSTATHYRATSAQSPCSRVHCAACRRLHGESVHHRCLHAAKRSCMALGTHAVVHTYLNSSHDRPSTADPAALSPPFLDWERTP